ncbi:MAG: thioesterase family protein [Candidatus Acidiferrum sp.]
MANRFRPSIMLIHKKEIQIEWGDCDPFGIVFYPRYFEYFDACTNALFHHALGYPKVEMLRRFQIAGIPMVQTSANFFVPSSFGDIVTVESSVVRWGTSSFSVEHKLFRGETLAVEGFEKRVWTVRPAGEPTKAKSQPIPKEVMEKFA